MNVFAVLQLLEYLGWTPEELIEKRDEAKTGAAKELRRHLVQMGR